MTFTFQERPGSGASTKESYESLWRASGSDDEGYVRSVAFGIVPSIVSITEGLLYRQDISVEPQGHKLFFVTASYGKRKKENGSYSLSFDTMGGTVHIKTSKETVGAYPEPVVPLAPPPDHKQTIGVAVTGEAPEGTDIIIPALKLTVNFKHPMGVISLARIKQLARNTAKVNSDTFLTFAPGEVLFLGARGIEGSDTETEVAYDFACSENVTGLTIGDIADIEKQGHDYAWIQFKPEVNDGRASTVPAFAYVERVYERANFASLLGFGG